MGCWTQQGNGLGFRYIVAKETIGFEHIPTFLKGDAFWEHV